MDETAGSKALVIPWRRGRGLRELTDRERVGPVALTSRHTVGAPSLLTSTTPAIQS